MFSWGGSDKDSKAAEAAKQSLTAEQLENTQRIFGGSGDGANALGSNDSSGKGSSNGSASDKGSDKSSKKKNLPGSFDVFDPTGLERAAKAARELDTLTYAKEAVEIAKEQERTKQAESSHKREASIANQKAFEIKRVQAQEEERRKTIETDQNARQQYAYYQDQLSRKRHQDQLNEQAKLKEREIQMQEQSQMRIESLRRQTAEYEAKIRSQTEEARATAEAKGRIEQERKNWDLHMQRAKMEQNEFRTTVLQGVREAGTMIGNGMKEYITDTNKLVTTVGVVTAMALGIYSARVSTRVVGNLLEAKLSQPPLVRETSRLSVSRLITHPFKTIKSKASTFSRADPSKVMENIILESKIQDRLEKFIVSTQNTIKNNAPFRNMLLHGPPGTGKTLFAKQLAQRMNLNYAVMTGADILPLGKASVNEIHKMFDWAESSRKGMVLFVDEAETFLRKRNAAEGGPMSEETRNALNAFLYRTGTSSKKFMVIFATNQPDQLDWAINDRTDEMVEFDLPPQKQRADMLKMYFDQLIVNGHQKAGGVFSRAQEIQFDDQEKDSINDSYFDSLSKTLDGFSGREINKLVVAWQATARGSLGCILSMKDMTSVVDQRLEQHKQRQVWENAKTPAAKI